VRHGTKHIRAPRKRPNFLELRQREVRRISLPRTPVNKGIKRAGAAKNPGPYPRADGGTRTYASVREVRRSLELRPQEPNDTVAADGC
jgi:hypothetical protein